MLEFDGVARRFGDLSVLEGVTFTVRPGQITGFVGANGAGKTTTMRIGMGILDADEGGVRWNSRPITRGDQRRFGYMPEERGLFPKAGVAEQLRLLGELHGLTARQARSAAESWLDRLGLRDRAADRLDTLSLGNQQRVQIIAALMHEPSCLILDEPFSGLDPVAVADLGELLRERARSGVPVLFSSHQLELVERICDELVMIVGGRVSAALEPPDSSQQSFGIFFLEVDGPTSWLADVPGVEVLDRTGDRVEFRALAEGAEQKVLAQAVAAGRVRNYGPVQASLTNFVLENLR